MDALIRLFIKKEKGRPRITICPVFISAKVGAHGVRLSFETNPTNNSRCWKAKCYKQDITYQLLHQHHNRARLSRAQP
jgi:hypothetical protein